MEYLRREAGLSQRALGDACEPKVNPSYIGLAERRGLVLGESHAKRLAAALGYGGDPGDLSEDIKVG